MKAVIDTGTMITLSSTCLMNVFRAFVKANNIELNISKAVAKESVWKPIENRRFALNAARIKKIMSDGTVKVIPQTKELENETNKILDAANNIFYTNSKNQSLKIIQAGEAEALAIAKLNGAKIMFVDERTTRALIENPLRLKQVLERRQGNPINMNEEKLRACNELIGNIKIFRSVDIIALAYEQGLFDGELDHGILELNAALYAAKYAGCAVSQKEIDDYVKGAKPNGK
jgi:hypothetical protein